jgi:hypothetical protein
MSIYATLWSLQFPRYSTSVASGSESGLKAFPAHIGTPTRGFGYEQVARGKDFPVK